MARQDPNNVLKLYGEAKSIRNPHENDWRMASAYCWPSHYTAWQTEGPAYFRQNNEAARRIAYDTTGARSLPKYKAILERLATPVSSKWHTLQPSNEYLKKSIQVRRYFDDLTRKLFEMRYHPSANFRASSSEVYGSMGVYGNGPIFIGRSQPSPLRRRPGTKYVACPLRDVFFLVDDEGNVRIVFRRFWLNCRQFKEKFPDQPYPHRMAVEAAKGDPSETRFFEYVHYVHVCAMDDHDPEALDVRRHPVRGEYIDVESKAYIGDTHGYASMPYLIPRTDTVSGDPYGYSPAIMVLASMGTASQMKKTSLKQGQKAVDPALLTHDDGVLNGTVDQRPGAVNPGGVDSQGRLLVARVPTGDFRVAETLLQDERKDIEDGFFVTLFQILTDTPEMTATEVVERVAEKAALLSPTMGRLQSEFLGPMIQREIEILTEIGEMPEMPPELIEARGEYETVYTSPMAKGMYAEEVSGYMRSFQFAAEASQITQDPSLVDAYDLKTALPEITDFMGAPSRWMSSPEEQAAKAEGRQQQSTDAELLKNAPALASAAKTASDMQQQAGASRRGR